MKASLDPDTAPAAPFFTQPLRQILAMLAVTGLVVAGAWLAFPLVLGQIRANVWLNGVIGGVFVLGVLACFWQVMQVMRSVAWIGRFSRHMDSAGKAPRLLAAPAAMLRSRGAGAQISATSQRSMLDSVATRVDESRDVTRYLVNLLIYLGLLGTFYGLATTVPAVVETIRNLAPQDGETGIEVFEKLMGGLEAQLGGMGTAFSSSLLGLFGSLVVGLLELFAGHAQNRFYRELEDWLSSITRLGYAGSDADNPAADADAVAGVLDRLAIQMEAMQALSMQAEAGRALLDKRIGALVDAVSRLADARDGQAQVAALDRLVAATDTQTGQILRVTEGQDAMIAALAEGAAQVDAESRMRLRSIDVQLLRILEEISAGRQESIAELRGEIAALTAALRGQG